MYEGLIKRVFTIPFINMVGVWIIVYYQISSNHHYNSKGETYKSISGSVSVYK